jgi:hypothetical protein
MSFARFLPKFGEDHSRARAQVERLQRDQRTAARMAAEGWPSRRRNTRRRAYKGAIIKVEDRSGVTYEMHATKGWRRCGRDGWPR